MCWDFGVGWWGPIGGILSLLFLAGLIVLIVWGVRKLSEGGSTAAKSDSIEIAKERYVKGEISKEEFEQLKKDLS
jgi:putative membrane protein